MGVDFVISMLWAGQLVAAIVLAWRTAGDRRWFGALGIVVGAIIGNLPFFVIQGPAVISLAFLLVLVATVVLLGAYAVTARWEPLIALLLFIAIPIAYRVLAYAAFPPSSSFLLRDLAVLGELSVFLAPIVCALACREILGMLDRRIASRRSA